MQCIGTGLAGCYPDRDQNLSGMTNGSTRTSWCLSRLQPPCSSATVAQNCGREVKRVATRFELNPTSMLHLHFCGRITEWAHDVVSAEGVQELPESPEKVAVVVVTYNSEGIIADLLASLEEGLEAIQWQLIISDNASTDNTLSVVRDLAPDATVIRMGRNAGYAAGINRAVAAADTHTAVLALNPDVRVAPNCVPNLLRALRTPGTGIAVPRIRNGEGVLSYSMRREPTVRRALGDAFLGARRVGRFPMFGELVTDDNEYHYERIVDWAEGSTQLISTDCWNTCGPWDEGYFLYSEETEFHLRARDLGFATKFVPSAEAVHLGGESGSSPPLWALLCVNRVRLFRQRNGPVRSLGYWLAVFLREVSRAALGHRISRAAVRALTRPTLLKEKPTEAWLSDKSYLGG